MTATVLIYYIKKIYIFSVVKIIVQFYPWLQIAFIVPARLSTPR